MRATVVAVVLAAALAGCAASPPKVSQIAMLCEAQYPRFPDFARCVDQQVDITYAAYAGQPGWDILEAYRSWLRAAADRVERGEMTDAEARLQLAELRSRLNAQAAQLRAELKAEAAADWQQRYQNFLSGVALWASINATNRAQQPAVPYTSGMVTCRAISQMVTCF